MTPAVVLGAVLLGATLVVARSALVASRRVRAADRLVATERATAGSRRPPLLRPPEWFQMALDRAAVDTAPALLWTVWMGSAGLLVLLALLIGGPGLALVAAGASGGGPLLALSLARDRRDRRVEAALPEALEAVARALRSGASLRLALREAVAGVGPPLATDLAAQAAAVEAGAARPADLGQWADRRPLPGVRLAVAALGLGAETGGAQARALDGVAETLRTRQAVAGEVRALSSQARLSGLVIALSPLGFSAFATATDPRTAQFLFRTPLGLGCLSLGLGLDAVAAVWMTRLCQVEP